MEVEIKVKVNDIEVLKTKLKKAGAKSEGKKTNVDHYFTVHHRDFMKTKECLRIRELPEKNKSILTYKPASTDEMKNGMIWKKEFEVEISDARTFSEILKHLDCKKLVTVDKIREIFKLNGLTITVDELKDIGTFMEIEKISDDVECAKKDILRLLELFGEMEIEKRYLFS